MKPIHRFIFLSLPVATIAVWAQDCGAHEGRPTRTIETVYASSNCGPSSSFREGRIIGSGREFRAVWQAITAGQYPELSPPAIDFKKRRAILVGLGANPNAGYRLELADGIAKSRRGVFHIRFREIRPSPEAIYAQVVVTPCVVVSIDRSIKRFVIDYEVVRAP